MNFEERLKVHWQVSPLRRLSGAWTDYRKISVSPNGKMIFFNTRRNTTRIELLDSDSVIKLPKMNVIDCAWSFDGAYLAVITIGRELRIYHPCFEGGCSCVPIVDTDHRVREVICTPGVVFIKWCPEANRCIFGKYSEYEEKKYFIPEGPLIKGIMLYGLDMIRECHAWVTHEFGLIDPDLFNGIRLNKLIHTWRSKPDCIEWFNKERFLYINPNGPFEIYEWNYGSEGPGDICKGKCLGKFRIAHSVERFQRFICHQNGGSLIATCRDSVEMLRLDYSKKICFTNRIVLRKWGLSEAGGSIISSFKLDLRESEITGKENKFIAYWRSRGKFVEWAGEGKEEIPSIVKLGIFDTPHRFGVYRLNTSTMTIEMIHCCDVKKPFHVWAIKQAHEGGLPSDLLKIIWDFI